MLLVVSDRPPITSLFFFSLFVLFVSDPEIPCSFFFFWTSVELLSRRDILSASYVNSGTRSEGKGG